MFTRPIYKVLIYIILTLISLISLTGCHEDETINRQLDAAEPLVVNVCDSRNEYLKNLKSADSIISQIDHTDTSTMSRRQLGRYRLLNAELDYKLYRDTLDGQELERTYRLFQSSDDKARLMRTLFLQSVYELNAQNSIGSIEKALAAKDLAIELNDTLYLAKLHGQLAYISNLNGNINGIISHSLTASTLYEAIGLHHNSNATAIDYAIGLYSNNEHHKNIETIDSLLRIIDPADTGMMIYAHENMIRSLISIDSLAEANRHLDNIINYASPDRQDFNIPFDLAVANKDIESVKKYLPFIIESDSIHYHYGVKMMAMYNYHKLAGNVDSALIYHERVYDSDSRAMLNSINQSIVRAESDYNARKANHNAEIAHRNRIYLLLSVIILGMTTLTVYLYGRSRFHRKVIEMQEKIAQIRELFDAIEVKDNAIAGLHSQVSRKESELSALNTRLEMRESLLRRMTDKTSEIYRARFREIGDLLATYYQKKDAPDRIRLSIYTDIENTMTALGSRESLDEIRQSLNLYNDNIITRFMADFPSLKKIDVNIFTFLVAGFKPAVIATICRLDINNLYSRRRRLKEKITQSDAKSKSEYLRYL